MDDVLLTGNHIVARAEKLSEDVKCAEITAARAELALRTSRGLLHAFVQSQFARFAEPLEFLAAQHVALGVDEQLGKPDSHTVGILGVSSHWRNLGGSHGPVNAFFSWRELYAQEQRTVKPTRAKFEALLREYSQAHEPGRPGRSLSAIRADLNQLVWLACPGEQP